MKKSTAYLLSIVICLVTAFTIKSEAKYIDSAIGKGKNHEQALENAKAEALRKAFGMYGATVKFPEEGKESFESIFGIKTRYFLNEPTIKRHWQDNAGNFYVEISADVDDKTLFVSSEGYGKTVEIAEDNAKASAIENAVGVYVSQEITDEMNEHGSRLREFTRTKAEGYVKHWQHKQGSPYEGPLGIHAQIIAEVVPHEVREILKQFKELGSVLLCVMQEVKVKDGLPQAEGEIEINWLERMLKEELTDEGYKVRTIVNLSQKQKVYNFLTKQVDQFLEEAFLMPNEESWTPQNRVSVAYLADLIIYGKIDLTVRKFRGGLDELVSEGNITIDVVRVGDTGALETITSLNVSSDELYIGAGQTGPEAVQNFFNRDDNMPTFQKEIAELLRQLKRRLGNPRQDVVIYAAGMMYQDYQELRALLSQFPYGSVKSVGTVYAKTLSRITVQLTDVISGEVPYQQQMSRLIEYLEKLPNCRVRKVSGQEIFTEFVR